MKSVCKQVRRPDYSRRISLFGMGALKGGERSAPTEFITDITVEKDPKLIKMR